MRCNEAGCTIYVCLSHADGREYWDYDMIDNVIDYRLFKCQVEGCPVVFCAGHERELSTCVRCSQGYRAGYLMGAYDRPSATAMDHMFRLCEAHTTTCERRLGEARETEEERVEEMGVEEEEMGEEEEEEERKEQEEEEKDDSDECGCVAARHALMSTHALSIGLNQRSTSDE